MTTPAYRYGRALAKVAFLPALGAAFDTLKNMPANFEASYAARSAVDPRLFPALAYTQPNLVAQSQGDPYASFDQMAGGGSTGGHRRRHRHAG